MSRGDKVTVWRRRVGSRVMSRGLSTRIVHTFEWRWTRSAPNGAIVGASTESYRNRKECLANAMRCMKLCEVEIQK